MISADIRKIVENWQLPEAFFGHTLILRLQQTIEELRKALLKTPVSDKELNQVTQNIVWYFIQETSMGSRRLANEIYGVFVAGLMWLAQVQAQDEHCRERIRGRDRRLRYFLRTGKMPLTTEAMAFIQENCDKSIARKVRKSYMVEPESATVFG